jgi:carbon storage regulator CsrA
LQLFGPVAAPHRLPASSAKWILSKPHAIQGRETMLVLSRKPGEKICIDGDIELQVLEICGNRIRLGITAPQECRIVRAERSFESNNPLRKQLRERLACSPR